MTLRQRSTLPRRALRIALFAAVAIAGCSRDFGHSQSLRIAAASSLRELLESTKRDFEATHPGVALVFSFDASSALARQIEAADGFHVFVSADAENVDRIAHRLDGSTRTTFLSNVLVMVARHDLAATAQRPEDLLRDTSKIALAGEAVPAGRYARILLARMGLLDALAPRIVSADNVRAARAFVESGAVDHAFVYATDARIARSAMVAWTAPPADDPGIAYVAAALAGAPPLAAAYVRWLRSETFQESAATAGFLPPR
jgi:molybdate transport system substrate-binding protein